MKVTNSLLAFSLAPAVLGCMPEPRSGYKDVPDTILGPDTPSDPETLGYFVNHFALNVNNVTRSMEFYSEAFGMRHMFTHYLTKHISVTYMSHSQGGRNGSAYQTTAEMLRYKNNNAGHVELFHLDTQGGKDIPGPDKRTSTFAHVGIIVPDPEATQERLEQMGVTIYKKVGAPAPTEGPLSKPGYLGDASNLSDEEWADFQKAMGELNYLNVFAADPDGNLLEILPLNEPNLFG